MRKLGKNATQRMALIKNQASSLLWFEKIETTLDRAKEVQAYAEKLITLAINTCGDSIEVEKKTKDAKGNDVTRKVINDGPKRLAARRKLMSKLNDLQEIRGAEESKGAYKLRTKDVKHPLIEKMFNQIGPKYAERAKELGQGGGYTRIYLTGQRKGDAAETAIIELV